MGDFAITSELRKAFNERNVAFYEIRIATPEEFYEAIGQAKARNPYGPFVTQHEISDYAKMRLFITTDKTAGIAITEDNNIVSVFNGGEKRGVLKTLLPVAIEQGGRKLDNYNSKGLSSLYELYGFNPVSKVKFNSKFAPDDWNYERDGEPDVVFWIHNGDSAEDVVFFRDALNSTIIKSRESKKIPHRSVNGILSDNEHDLRKAMDCIAHLQENEIDIGELEAFLAERFKTKDYYKSISGNEKSALNRLVRIFDWMKYGK